MRNFTYAIFVLLFLPAFAHNLSKESLESNLGQLLYVNVDGYGQERTAVHQTYIAMVASLNLGGALTHFGTEDIEKIQQAVAQLKKVAKEPLLIGIDYATIEAPLSGTKSWVGLGFGAGLIGIYGSKVPPACLAELFFLQALLHRALGLNHSLGPTVDRSKRYGFLDRDAAQIMPHVESLLEQLEAFDLLHAVKHFPFTPDTFSLHDISKDLALTPEQVAHRTTVFKSLAPKVDMVMTTHLFNSNIDPHQLVTFSPTWMEMLKNTGFKGLVITDALLMIRDYQEPVRKMTTAWKLRGDPQIERLDSIFAIQAIMAGHDLVILEGTAKDTQAVHADLIWLLRQNTPLGNSFRRRVQTALERVAAYKKEHDSELTSTLVIPDTATERAILLFNQILQEATGTQNPSSCTHGTTIKLLKRMLPFESVQLR